jgi:hypothetical protein
MIDLLKKVEADILITSYLTIFHALSRCCLQREKYMNVVAVLLSTEDILSVANAV